MSTLAVVVDWRESAGSGPGSPDATARRMVDCLRDRAPDGLGVAAAPGAGLAIGKLVVAHKQGHAAQPLVDPEAQLHLVADVRIDNRADLKAELALPAAATDAEIVLAGYRRWGSGLPEHLIGDFAFVVWDARLRTVFAARDPFGVRPLVYRVLPDRLLVASDVEQILEVDPTAWEVDDHAVVDYLVGNWRRPDRTYFRAITAVRGGYYLLARAGGSFDVARWWRPRTMPVIADHQQCDEEFRRRLDRAVDDRVDSDHPVLVQVSGGFDSPAIAITAGRVGARVSLRAISAEHPGLDCDERSFVEALEPHLPYPVEYWDGTQVVLPDLEAPALAGPGRRASFNNGSRGGLDIAAREGARVILSGHGGDVWQPSWPSLGDYLRGRRWRQLVELGFLRPHSTWRNRFRILRISVRRSMPERLARALTPWKHHDQEPPPYLTAQAQDWLSEPAEPGFEGDLPTAADRARLRELCQPRTRYVIDLQQSCTARALAEVRFPFLDTRLLELLWALPLSIWTTPGYPGRFHARVLRHQLPRQIADRQRKTLFTSAAAHRNDRARPSIEALLRDGRSWKSGRYVSQQKAWAAQRTDRQLAWTLATLERWLEMLYGAPRQTASAGNSRHAFKD